MIQLYSSKTQVQELQMEINQLMLNLKVEYDIDYQQDKKDVILKLNYIIIYHLQRIFTVEPSLYMPIAHASLL